MGTFHDNLGPLHGMTVVVDCNGPKVVVGRCHEVTDERVILHDADIHEDGAGGVSKTDYLQRAAKIGTWARHSHLSVPVSEVASIRLLGELQFE